MRRLTCLALLSLTVSILHAAPAHATVEDGPCSGSASGDFNGDGNADLAVGVPDEDLPAGDAGAVNVIYGSPTGLIATGNQFWTQNSTDIEGAAEAGDRLGACLAAGDFDGDLNDDLAVGAPSEDIGSLANAGSVNVIYGSSPDGLSATATRPDQIWHQDSTSILGAAESGDKFGGALTAGDFNGDGRDDLAIGAPFEDIGSKADAGSVNVLKGSASGLTATGNQLWHQDSTDIEGVSEADDKFGSSLAAGRFNSDGGDDLAIGVPEEDIGGIVDAGAVNVIYGAGGGLIATNDQVWYQDSPAIAGGSEANDNFGRALAAGDFNGNGRGDLAVGVPLEDIGALADAGAVNVLYGATSGLSATGNQILTQDGLTATADVSEAGDRFGASLAAADFNDTLESDLAVGVPFEDTAVTNTGAVETVHGSGSGLALTFGSNALWSQDAIASFEGTEGAMDSFGAALTAANFDGTGPSDLAIGVPMDDEGVPLNAGVVNVVYGGAASGVHPANTPNDQLWRQGTGPAGTLLDTADLGDMFGSAAG